VPGIFTDCQPDLDAVHIYDHRFGARSEVAVFVEHVVGREQTFVIGHVPTAIAEQHCRVVDRGSCVVLGTECDTDDEGRARFSHLRECIECLLLGVENSPSVEQVTGRIAHQREFRSHH